MDAFIGTIMPVAFNFPPRGWASCNGQLVPISQNAAAFALLGTLYGGDGHQTFGIPDLRGRTAVGAQANGPGLQPIHQGDLSGNNTVTVIGSGSTSFTLGTNNLPAHTHTATMSLSGLTASTTISVGTGTTGGSTTAAAGSTLTGTATGTPAAAAIYLPAATTPLTPVNLGGVNTTVTGTGSVTNSNTGSGQAVAAPVTTTATISIMQPYLGLNFIIAMEGIFPSRN